MSVGFSLVSRLLLFWTRNAITRHQRIFFSPKIAKEAFFIIIITGSEKIIILAFEAVRSQAPNFFASIYWFHIHGCVGDVVPRRRITALNVGLFFNVTGQFSFKRYLSV